MVTMAKGIANGFPMGAVVTTAGEARGKFRQIQIYSLCDLLIQAVCGFVIFIQFLQVGVLNEVHTRSVILQSLMRDCAGRQWSNRKQN